MSALGDTLEQQAAWLRSRVRLAVHPPFYTAGSCPISDTAGNAYDWFRVCGPGWWLTGAIVDASGAVLGSAVLLADDVALTAARVLQDRDVDALRFSWSLSLWEDRPDWSSLLRDVRQPRTDVRYGDPPDLADLVARDSSDIALLRLVDRIPQQPASWVSLGDAPDPLLVRYLARHPDARCGSSDPERCLVAFADAVLCSYYDRSHEYLTPVQWSAVAENGSVLVAWLDYQPGAENIAAVGRYRPEHDLGAPVIWPGTTLRSEVCGVVSGTVAVPDAGTYYRITRCDRWASWIAGVLSEWHPGAVLPGPPPPAPAPATPRGARFPVRRRGSIAAAGFFLSVGSAALLALGRR